jgi:small-conductance mechanosensitive channel
MIASYLLSRKFVNAEFDKLDMSSNMFDRIIILSSASILSTVIIIVSLVMTTIITKYCGIKCKTILFSYAKLMIIYSLILIINYSLVAPKHSKHRMINVNDGEATHICSKLYRIAIVSFFYTIIFYPIVVTIKHASYGLMTEYLLCGMIITYYFIEMILSNDVIKNIFSINRYSRCSLSVKLTTFVTEKFPYILYFGMIYITITNFYSKINDDIMMFANLNSIYWFLFEIFSFQGIIVFLINKFLKQVDFLGNCKGLKKTTKNREENLIRICDIVVFSLYFFGVCFVLSYSGISVKQYIIHDAFITSILTLVFTFIILKGFKEYRYILLERAENIGNSYHVKLKTFIPTISMVFYVFVSVVSSMIMLSNFGVNVTPILATFSIFSAAVGLAAKDIIQSFLHGVVLLAERNLFVGDLVKINDMKGIIEKFSVRVIYLRNEDGRMHVIPYNCVNSITNYSNKYIAYFDTLRVKSIKDVEKAKKILIATVAGMKESKKYSELIIGDVIIHGTKPFDFAGIKIYWEVKTIANGNYVLFEIYDRIAKEFEKNGIEIPVANSINVNVIEN